MCDSENRCTNFCHVWAKKISSPVPKHFFFGQPSRQDRSRLGVMVGSDGGRDFLPVWPTVRPSSVPWALMLYLRHRARRAKEPPNSSPNFKHIKGAGWATLFEKARESTSKPIDRSRGVKGFNSYPQSSGYLERGIHVPLAGADLLDLCLATRSRSEKCEFT